jgi:pimeloyl-ACP methyl ester carboxylesterase
MWGICHSPHQRRDLMGQPHRFEHLLEHVPFTAPKQKGPIMAQPTPTTTRLTVILVHGAFADASSWNGVMERLQQQGYTAIAPANPLRGVLSDSAYIASLIKQIDGPILLVAHSYGGAVISNAAAKAKNVVGLVFVAALAPEEGERLADVQSKDSILNPLLSERRYPTGSDGETATEYTIDPAHFRRAYAADVPEERTRLMAAAQRPIAGAAFADTSGPVAWKALPSWAIVATEDVGAGTDIVRAMAQRAGAQVTELKGSHAIMISQPQAVTEVIVRAAAAVSTAAAAVGMAATAVAP